MSEANKTKGLRRHNQELNNVICDSLRQALVVLLNEKDFKKITITELCKKAGVSRMAFYGNFESMDDLLKSIVVTYNSGLMEKIGSPFRKTTNIDWYIHLFEEIYLYSTVLRIFFKAGFKYKYLSIINELVLHDSNISTHEKYLRLTWAGGLVNAIISWIDERMTTPVRDIAEVCNKTLTPYIKTLEDLIEEDRREKERAESLEIVE